MSSWSLAATKATCLGPNLKLCTRFISRTRLLSLTSSPRCRGSGRQECWSGHVGHRVECEASSWESCGSLGLLPMFSGVSLAQEVLGWKFPGLIKPKAPYWETMYFDTCAFFFPFPLLDAEDCSDSRTITFHRVHCTYRPGCPGKGMAMQGGEVSQARVARRMPAAPPLRSGRQKTHRNKTNSPPGLALFLTGMAGSYQKRWTAEQVLLCPGYGLRWVCQRELQGTVAALDPPAGWLGDRRPVSICLILSHNMFVTFFIL